MSEWRRSLPPLVMRSCLIGYQKECRRLRLPVVRGVMESLETGVLDMDLSKAHSASIKILARMMTEVSSTSRGAAGAADAKEEPSEPLRVLRVVCQATGKANASGRGRSQGSQNSAVRSSGPPCHTEASNNNNANLAAEVALLSLLVDGVRRVILHSSTVLRHIEFHSIRFIRLPRERVAGLMHAIAMCRRLQVLRFCNSPVAHANLVTLTATARAFAHLEEAVFSRCGLTDRCQKEIVSFLRLHRDYQAEGGGGGGSACGFAQALAGDGGGGMGTTDTLRSGGRILSPTTTNISSPHTDISGGQRRSQRAVRGLCRLDLSHNAIADATLLTLLRAIQETGNQILHHLNLSFNRISPAAVQQLMISGMLEDSGLLRLDLSGNAEAAARRAGEEEGGVSGGGGGAAFGQLTIPLSVQQLFTCVAEEPEQLVFLSVGETHDAVEMYAPSAKAALPSYTSSSLQPQQRSSQGSTPGFPPQHHPPELPSAPLKGRSVRHHREASLPTRVIMMGEEEEEAFAATAPVAAAAVARRKPAVGTAGKSYPPPRHHRANTLPGIHEEEGSVDDREMDDEEEDIQGCSSVISIPCGPASQTPPTAEVAPAPCDPLLDDQNWHTLLPLAVRELLASKVEKSAVTEPFLAAVTERFNEQENEMAEKMDEQERRTTARLTQLEGAITKLMERRLEEQQAAQKREYQEFLEGLEAKRKEKEQMELQQQQQKVVEDPNEKVREDLMQLIQVGMSRLQTFFPSTGEKKEAEDGRSKGNEPRRTLDSFGVIQSGTTNTEGKEETREAFLLQVQDRLNSMKW